MDTRKLKQTAAFDQHFKKSTHLVHEKVINKVEKSYFEETQNINEPQIPNMQNVLQNGPNRSLLDLKVIETWINDMLVEAELNVKMDNKSKHMALKKFGIDRKTLKTRGLSQGDIDRIFRCLFIYSFGFYQMLLEILSHSNDLNTLMSQLWKVFGILLEYCSRGDFKSTVNELEKEKRAQIEKMEILLQEKEKQLSALEEREKERHVKLISDVNHLSQQRDMLLIEKTQLEEDFKQADLAFNDEVALRLKFEYRINEIHSIHRELIAKHNKLLDDIILSKKQIERLEKDQQVNKRQVETMVIDKRGLEAEINNLKIQIDNLQMTLKGKDQQIRELDVKLAVLKKQENRDYIDRKDYEHSQQTFRLKVQNLESNILSLKQNEIDTSRSLKEQIQNVDNQVKRIALLDKEVQDYQKLYFEANSKLEHITKVEKKLRESLEQIRVDKFELESSRNLLLQEKKKQEVDLQFLQQKADIQEREIAMLNQNVQQMKNIKMALDDDYVKERVKVDALLGSVASKEDMITELEKCLSYSQQRLHTVTTELIEAENRFRMKDDDYRIQVTGMQKKIEFQDICLANERQELHNDRDKILKLNDEMDYLRAELSDLKSQHKTELFEKNNLVTKNIFMNRVIDNERTRNSELLIEITQLKILIENTERDNKTLKVINLEQLDHFKDEMQLIKHKYENQIEDYKNTMKELTYKMHHEDALSDLARTNNQLRELRAKNQQLYQVIIDKDININTLKATFEIVVTETEQIKSTSQLTQQSLSQSNTKTALMNLIIKQITAKYNTISLQLQSLQQKYLRSIQYAHQLEQANDKHLSDLDKVNLVVKKLRKTNMIERVKKHPQGESAGRQMTGSSDQRGKSDENFNLSSQNMRQQDDDPYQPKNIRKSRPAAIQNREGDSTPEEQELRKTSRKQKLKDKTSSQSQQQDFQSDIQSKQLELIQQAEKRMAQSKKDDKNNQSDIQPPGKSKYQQQENNKDQKSFQNETSKQNSQSENQQAINLWQQQQNNSQQQQQMTYQQENASKQIGKSGNQKKSVNQSKEVNNKKISSFSNEIQEKNEQEMDQRIIVGELNQQQYIQITNEEDEAQIHSTQRPSYQQNISQAQVLEKVTVTERISKKPKQNGLPTESLELNSSKEQIHQAGNSRNLTEKTHQSQDTSKSQQSYHGFQDNENIQVRKPNEVQNQTKETQNKKDKVSKQKRKSHDIKSSQNNETSQQQKLLEPKQKQQSQKILLDESADDNNSSQNQHSVQQIQQSHEVSKEGSKGSESFSKKEFLRDIEYLKEMTEKSIQQTQENEINQLLPSKNMESNFENILQESQNQNISEQNLLQQSQFQQPQFESNQPQYQSKSQKQRLSSQQQKNINTKKQEQNSERSGRHSFQKDHETGSRQSRKTQSSQRQNNQIQQF